MQLFTSTSPREIHVFAVSDDNKLAIVLNASKKVYYINKDMNPSKLFFYNSKATVLKLVTIMIL